MSAAMSGSADGDAAHGRLRVAVKDNIVTQDTRTTCASATLADYTSPFRAKVIDCLVDSGRYQVIGKTNLDEFGMGSHSQYSNHGGVRNAPPYEHSSAGGSSGGSAVAVAQDDADIALGTDTGGSVRLPAAYTGLFGFKPSYGAISRWGVVPYANSLDTVGIIARDVASLTEMYEHLGVADDRDPSMLNAECRALLRVSFASMRGKSTRSSIQGMRIGIPVEYNLAELDEGVRAAWVTLLEGCQRLGAEVASISLPSTKHALSAYYVLAPAEAASNLAKFDGIRYGSRDVGTDQQGHVLYSGNRGNNFGDEVKRRILLGSYTLSSTAMDNYFTQAQRVRRLVQRDHDRVFAKPSPLRPGEQFDLCDLDDGGDEGTQLPNKRGPHQVDVIICPTAPTLPPSIKELQEQISTDAYLNDVFTVPASLAGLPALSVPVAVPQQGQPDRPTFVGMQIMGQLCDDGTVLGLASCLHEHGLLHLRI